MSLESRKEMIIKEYQKLKEERVKLEERISMLTEELQNRYGISTVEELQKKIDECDKTLEKLDGRINPLLDRIEGGLGIR